MRKRSPKPKKYWLKHFKRWESSGLTQIEYCRLNNIPISSFTNKKSKLAEEIQDTNSLVELEMPIIDLDSTSKIELRLPGGIQLLIQEDIDPSRLRRIVLAFGDM